MATLSPYLSEGGPVSGKGAIGFASPTQSAGFNSTSSFTRRSRRKSDYLEARKEAMRSTMAKFVVLGDDATCIERVKQYYSQHKVITKSFGVIVLYLLLGALIYSWLEPGWTFIDGLYFCVVSMSTTGYGDLHPSNSLTKIVTTFFIMIGLGIIGAALSVLSKAIMARSYERTTYIHTKATTNLITAGEVDVDAMEPDEDAKEEQAAATAAHSSPEKERRRSWCCTWWETMIHKLLPTPRHRQLAGAGARVGCVLLIGFLWFLTVEGMSAVDAYYFTCITVFTVGYGAPDFSQFTRLFIVVYLLFGWTTIGVSIRLFAEVISVPYQQELARDMLEQQMAKITTMDLALMDEDGDNKVDWGEFLAGQLKALELINPQLIEVIRSAYKTLDADGSGVVDSTDIKRVKAQRAEIINAIQEKRRETRHSNKKKKSSITITADSNNNNNNRDTSPSLSGNSQESRATTTTTTVMSSMSPSVLPGSLPPLVAVRQHSRMSQSDTRHTATTLNVVVDSGRK